MTTIKQTMTLADLHYQDGWAIIDIGGAPHEIRAMAGTFDVRKADGGHVATLPLTVLDADATVVVTREFEGAEVMG